MGTAGTAPTAQGAQAGFKFIEVKRLGQVVVSAQVQSHDAVAHRAARRQDQHGRHQTLLACLLQYLQAVQAGQAQVQQHHIGLGLRPVRHGK